MRVILLLSHRCIVLTSGEFGENWLSVQVLWIIGCACFLLNAVLSFLLCCDSCKGPFCSITLTVLVFIACK